MENLGAKKQPNPAPNENQGETKFDPLSRYYDSGGIEVQEIIKAKLTKEQYEGFCLGNIIKYSCRANFKGSLERDIDKVGFYQRFLLESINEDN